MSTQPPKRGELTPYIPERGRSKYFLTRNIGEQIYYDAPTTRTATRWHGRLPSNGEFPCSDPDMAFRQLIMEAGLRHRVLEPAAYPARISRGAGTRWATALNEWQAHHCWTATKLAQRWRGSICAAIEEPEEWSARIEKWAGTPTWHRS